MCMFERFAPDVIIVVVGANDLSKFNPEMVSFQIKSLVHQLTDSRDFKQIATASADMASGSKFPPK